MNNKIMRFLAIGSLLLSLGAQGAAVNRLHPEVPILDASGNLVIESGEPMSSMATCGGDCHQTAYIMANSDHSDAGASRLGGHGGAHDWQQGPGYFGGWNPLAYDTVIPLEQVLPFEVELTTGHEKLPFRSCPTQLVEPEPVAALNRFGVDAAQVVGHRSDRRRLAAESRKLGMMPVAARPASEHRLCQQSLSPEGDQAS